MLIKSMACLLSLPLSKKTTSRSPRSTVGTITELYDYFRLLFARIGTAYSYLSNEKMIHYTDAQIVSLIVSEYLGQKNHASLSYC